ncbi:MAG: sugar transferase [Woeseiaceae bacterium]|nr:sugar transferase [Gammaproteobacteria bacterium]NNK24820.1 sugar transferase [Woeseiaceae bacterium]
MISHDEKREAAGQGERNPSFHGRSALLRRLLYILDVLTVTFAYVLTVAVVPALWPENGIDASRHYGLLPIVIAVFAVSRHMMSQDLALGRTTMYSQVYCILKEMVQTIGVLLILIFLLKLQFVSRLVVGWFGVLSVSLLIMVRLIIHYWYFLRRTESLEQALNVLIIGSGRRAHILAKKLQASFEWHVNIVGFLDPKGESAGRREGDEIAGHVDEIGRILRDNVIEDVVVAVPRSMLGDVQSIVDACQEEGVRLRFMADIYDFDAKKVNLSMVGGIPLLGIDFVDRDHNSLIAKRLFDIVVTLAAMPVLLPILVVTAIAIKLDSRGPVFFVQQRVGLYKKLFPMIKFRSMVVDAEARMKEIEHLNEADGANFKIKEDPRITRVGRFIRRTSIDELPQLINVLLGDMSLVGPRPMSIRDVSLFDKGVQRKRFSVRPGITGLWQVSGRSDLPFDRWIELDLEYIDRWSFMGDVKILFRTIPAVLRGSGAV